MEQAALCGFKNTPPRSCGCLQAVVSLDQSQSEGARRNARYRWDVLNTITPEARSCWMTIYSCV